jgi:phage terminase large subunit-like protein
MASRKRRAGAVESDNSEPHTEVRGTGTILGRREPAYSLIPKHRTSKGPEAVELMTRAGLTLDEWQRDVLEGAMGVSKGRWTAPETVLLAPRQNGKTECVAAAALWIAVSGPKKLVIISSHETKTNEELFLRMRDIVETSAFEEFAPRVYTANGRESIKFSNGSRIKFIARSKHQGRGFSADAIFIDEAFILSDASWSSLKPTLSASRQPMLWLISSAPHPDSAVLRRYCLRGRAGEDKNLCYFEWAAPLDAAPDSFEAWAASNPALGRISLETVASELKALNPEAFGRERLGIWDPSASGGVFDSAQWAALAAPGPAPEPGYRALALDINPARTRACIAAAAELPDERVLVEILREDKGVDWVVPELLGLHREDSSVAIVVDEASQARTLIPDLKAAGLSVVTTDVKGMTAASALFFDHVVESRLLHLDQPVLNSAVSAATQRAIGDNWAWARRAPKGDISALVAASLALWGVRNPQSGDFWRFLDLNV